MHHIVLDTETTGTDPRRDKIVEIGAVELLDYRPTGRTFHAYYNPGIPVPIEAQQVHGLTDAFLADYPLFAPAPVLAFLQDATIVAHNAPFDVGFLNAALPQPLTNPIVDTLALARERHPGAPASLDALCRRYGISTAARTNHGALIDAQLLAKVFAELVVRQASLDLVARADSAEVAPLPVRHRPLPARLTELELAQHIALVNEIPSALWRRVAA